MQGSINKNDDLFFDLKLKIQLLEEYYNEIDKEHNKYKDIEDHTDKELYKLINIVKNKNDYLLKNIIEIASDVQVKLHFSLDRCREQLFLAESLNDKINNNKLNNL